MNNKSEYLKNELIQKHRSFIQKNNPSNFFICSQNLEVSNYIKIFINSESDNNTLYLYGNNGIGKTHLIGSLISEKSDCLYIDTSDFINTYYEYQKLEKDFSELTNWLRTFNLIVFDSLDLIKDKPNIKQLLETYIKNSGKQKIISIGINNSQPYEFKIIKQLPDPNINDLQIITSKFLSSYNSNIRLTKAALNYLSSILGNNIQTIVNKLINWLVIFGNPNSLTPIGIEDLNKTLKIDLHNHKQVQEICKKLNINAKDLISKTRTQKIVFKRDIAIYLLKKKLLLTHETIGILLNKKHSTISHSIKKIEEKIKDPIFKQYLETFF
ncbi:helix-turn-helix domain-containing protein [Candidatus Mycoplasma haematohominis]|uniref:helix-turn-helix domain-containing protein n=1 Tax=Candidatus Mycoplasma haematohominis TaxID=1494318 RepID=UPI001C0A6A37|nr:helix-turn-helix domain-containing protein [Candidatus Mycoplasma haemohominis]